MMGLFAVIKGWFSGVLREFRSFMSKLFKGALEMVLAQLKDIALQAVTTLAETDLSNEEKRKAAFEQIKKDAISKGISTKDSVINLAIELAVQALKEKIS